MSTQEQENFAVTDPKVNGDNAGSLTNERGFSEGVSEDGSSRVHEEDSPKPLLAERFLGFFKQK